MWLLWSGEALSVLDGVPIGIKDEIDCMPYPTTGKRFLLPYLVSINYVSQYINGQPHPPQDKIIYMYSTHLLAGYNVSCMLKG